MTRDRTSKVLRKLDASGLKLNHSVAGGRPRIYSDSGNQKYIIRLTSKTSHRMGGRDYPIYYLRLGGLPQRADYLLLALFDGARLAAILKLPTDTIEIENNEISANLDPAYVSQAIWIAEAPLSKTA